MMFLIIMCTNVGITGTITSNTELIIILINKVSGLRRKSVLLDC